MGARFRLKAGFDISGYSAANQVILTALKTYGMILADNGSSWFISGAPDTRFDDSDLHNLTRILGSNFEAVDVLPLMVDPNSGQARQGSIAVSVTPASASVQVNTPKRFTASVTGSSNTAVTWDVNGTVGGNGTVGFIDSISGLYTAPAAPPSPATVTVHATTNATPAVSGSATVTVTAPAPPPPPPSVGIAITPIRIHVRVSAAHQFTATVTGTTDTAVTWQVNGVAGGSASTGTVSAAGLYQAPSKVPPVAIHVTAISHADASKTASASVTVTKR